MRQEYFFVSCAVQDILRRFKSDGNAWDTFPDKVFMQLNDTHPSLAIVELMRLLIDREGLGWDQAWGITTASTGYTNHTILSEAMEKWPISMLEQHLPRHLNIIYEMNGRFMREVAVRYPFDGQRLSRMSMIEEGVPKHVRMANLAIVGSCSINGVSKLHTELLKNHVMRFLRILSSEVQQQDERDHAAPVAAESESAAGAADHGSNWRPMDHGPG